MGRVVRKKTSAPPARGRAKAVPAPIFPDGHPLDEVHYREYKIILRPERFRTSQAFLDFAGLVRHAVKQTAGAKFVPLDPNEHHIREVLFYDTRRFALYRNAFILRTRRIFQNGWPTDEQELTIKFRHPSLEAAANVEMIPHTRTAATWRIKFKEELLPAKNAIGRIRSLFSHNCVLVSKAAVPAALGDIARTFPSLHRLEIPPRTPLDLVNRVAVEEVFADIGHIHFGHGLDAKATLAVWRDRGTQVPLVGEFGFQCKFNRYDALHAKPKRRSEDFFVRLQRAARSYLLLGTTKTAIVYGLGAGTFRRHE